MNAVEGDVVFYDESGGGATFSGGEPLAQPDFLHALLEACRGSGIHTAVDTSGMADPEVVRRIHAGTDLFLYDLKWIDDGRHRAHTGVSNAQILDNLKYLSKAGAAIILRLPLIPGVNDDEENIAGIGAFASALEQPHPVDLLPYHEAGMEKYSRLNRIYRLPDTEPPGRESLARAAALLRKHGLEVTVRGESNDHE
jgi:pyruvate formate lyase activating enzyme